METILEKLGRVLSTMQQVYVLGNVVKMYTSYSHLMISHSETPLIPYVSFYVRFNNFIAVFANVKP
jgi:hypothetical protein